MTTTLQYTPLADIPKIHEELRAGFYSGKLKSLSYRRYQLLQLAYAFQENIEAFNNALYADLARPPLESDLAELGAILNEIKYVLDNFESWAKTEKAPFNIKYAAMKPIIRKEAKGVVLIITPFNYPLFLAIAPVAGAIAAGNTVLLKASEQTPASSSLMAQMLHKYLDPDVIRVVNGAVPETTKLLELRWDHILYTGGEKVGRIVATAAAKHTTPVTLELGGKSPVFIDPSCDLVSTTKRLLWGKYVNAGQTCVSPDYVMVPEHFKDTFLKVLKETYNEFFANVSPSNFTHLISSNAYDRISSMITSSHGSIVAGGMKGADQAQKFIPPTVVENVRADDSLMSDEIFGPILPIMTVKDVDEAIRFVNERPHPLALYVFATDNAVKKKVMDNTQSGGVLMNEILIHIGIPGIPFGGVGNSGYGAYTGKYTFDMFTHFRCSIDAPSWIDKLLSARFPPYSDKKRQALTRLAPKFPPKPKGPPTAQEIQASLAGKGGKIKWSSWFVLAAFVALLSKNYERVPTLAGLIARIRAL
ncbi:NAD-aldehyde dehydrogenase [Pterulicium gracile]|uniref:Aldehyde dehydrogenase n=1 Tax=Pterulicium gracile TaxID=1884261 RepID=A0A5C3QAD5_9AGAR|nr:NAD-aldehyde dehydrogenase [Pterula gracilis]